jgi:hypothetical protein
MTCKLFVNIQYKNYTVIDALKELEKLEKEEKELQNKDLVTIDWTGEAQKTVKAHHNPIAFLNS